MSGPRVLIVLDSSAAWSRGILRGIGEVAHERGWILLHYHPSTDLEWLLDEWKPAAAVLRPVVLGPELARLDPRKVVMVNQDTRAFGIACVCLDEEKIAELACAHLVSKGLKNFSTFRFDDEPFAVARERRFCEAARATGGRVVEGWWVDGAEPSRAVEDPPAMAAWLRGLPKPCGVFACCDSWARVVARYCRVAGVRIPEDVALVGVDNDTSECEITAPPLTSVAVPWRALGRQAASLVARVLAGETIAGERVVIEPVDVIPRRSSDVLAIEDPLVVNAVKWICENAGRRVTVPAVARALSVSRQRLERRFRAVLGRTVMQEVRRAHIDLAKRLLSTTSLDLSRVARQSGFTSAALLSVAFRNETGLPPGAYRRRFQGLYHDAD
jgi:LacI family transcriptional regulator